MRFVAAGTSMRVAEGAISRGFTARVARIAAVASAAAADVFVARVRARTRLIRTHLGPRGWWRLVVMHFHLRAVTDPRGRRGGSHRVGPGQADTHGHVGGWGGRGGIYQRPLCRLPCVPIYTEYLKCM